MPPKKKNSRTDADADCVTVPVPSKSKATAAATHKKKEEREVSQEEDEDAPPLKKRRTSSGTVVTAESVRVNTTPFERKTKNADFNAKTMVKFISWNVAGLRAICKGSDLTDLMEKEKPDVLAIQEVRIQDLDECAKTGKIEGYSFSDCVCVGKKGYSGTRTYIRDGMKAEHLSQGFTVGETAIPDEEGRVLTTLIELGSAAGKEECKGSAVALVNSYVPNSGLTLDRLDYRVGEYDPMIRRYLKELKELHSERGTTKGRGVIWTGDLNVAERDYDRFFNNFKAMQKCPGFTPEEKASFRTTLSETGMVDSFRHLYPNAHDTYTFWSKRFGQKAKGNGWRLDYFIVSPQLVEKVVDVFPLPEYESSDHCPLVLWLRK